MVLSWARGLEIQLALLAVLVLACDRLLYGAEPGLGLALTTLLVAAGILVRHRYAAASRRELLIALAVVGGGAGAVLAAGSTLGVLWCLLGLAMLSLLVRAGQLLAPGYLLLTLGMHAFSPLARPFRDLHVLRRLREHHRSRLRLHAGALGWLAPLLLGAAFIPFFAAANPIVAAWCQWAWDRLWGVGLPPMDRMLLWIASASAIWMLIRARWTLYHLHPLWSVSGRRTYGRKGARTIAAQNEQCEQVDVIGSVTTGFVVRCLCVFNGVFLVHNLLDARYLWGGSALPAQMTYAEYAHRGAHVLMITALLSAGFILLWFRPGGVIEERRDARFLVFAWLVQNVVLLAGSGYRLWLYVEVYGLTRWRCAAAIWLLVVASGLLLILWRIFRRKGNRWLVDANLLVVALLLGACAWIDVDAVIAWQNVTCQQRNPDWPRSVDIPYLESLGPSSLPALAWLSSTAKSSTSEDAARLSEIRTAMDRLIHELATDSPDWRSLTLQNRCLRQYR